MTGHIVKRFDAELEDLRGKTLAMGCAVREQLEAVGRVILKADPEEAQEVESADRAINRREKELDALVELLLARRTPHAGDLRMMIGSLRMTTDFERMGDEVRDAAKAVRKMGGFLAEALWPTRDALLTIHAHLLVMTTEALRAVETLDAEGALAIVERERVVRNQTREARESLKKRLVSGHTEIEAGIELIRVAHTLERVAAHLANIAETVVFIREGLDIRHAGAKHGG